MNYQKQISRFPSQLRKRYAAAKHRFIRSEDGGKHFSISIMAHPSRREMAEKLRRSLNVVPISYDEGGGLWHNCKGAWSLHRNKKYHLVLQDDSVICDRFVERVDRLIEGLDDRRCLSLYAGSRKIYRSLFEKRMSRGYVVLPDLHWGVAVMLPTDLIPSMMRFGDLSPVRTDDTKISQFCKSINMPVHYPLPSLVDHAGVASLVGDAAGRKAFAFVGAKND